MPTGPPRVPAGKGLFDAYATVPAATVACTTLSATVRAGSGKAVTAPMSTKIETLSMA